MAKAPRPRIAGVVAERALGGEEPKKLSRSLAAYLISEHRVQELDSILRDVMDDWAKAGHLEVLAYSAHPLTPALKAEIVQRIRALSPQAKEIIVTEQHDPEAVGGVRLRLANRELDLSVEHKLNQFKQLTGAGKD